MLDLQAVTLAEMSRETRRDDTLSKLIEHIQDGKWSRDEKLKPFKAVKDELSVYEGVILRGNRRCTYCDKSPLVRSFEF